MPEQLKPGEHGSISVSAHGSDFKARVRICLFDGSLVSLSRTRDTKSAARIAVQEAIKERLDCPQGSEELKHNSKVGLTCRQWINELRVQSTWPDPQILPQTIDEYERLIGNHLIPYIGNRRLNQLTPKLCQEWLNQIIEKGKTGENSLVVTAHQVRMVFEKVIDRAILHDALRDNPVSKTKLPKRKTPDPRSLTALEVYRLRMAVRDWEANRIGKPGPRPTGHLPVAVDLMLGTGLRIGEVTAMRWGEVCLDQPQPTVEVKATMVSIRGQGIVRQEKPKTDAGERIIVIPPFTVDALLSIRPDSPADDFPVFPSRRFKKGSTKRTGQTPHNVRRTLRDALELAGMKGEVYPHLLRKTVATFVARERGMADAAALLGHRINGGVTQRHYIERLRLAPDVSSVLQTMIEYGEAEAKAINETSIDVTSGIPVNDLRVGKAA